MNKYLSLSIFFLLLCNVALFGQEINVTGVVTSSEDGSSLPGVYVVVQGTNTGVITDVDGKFSVAVPDTSASLTFSYVGFLSETIKVGAQKVINLTMSPDITGLQEVVVTALGIQKKARELTYSTQQVNGQDITSAHDLNLVNSLSGKSAGILITRSSSGPGGSSRVILRGNKSISGNNEPLYVIDGVPLNSSSLGQIGGAQLYGTLDGGDAISNLNQDDIESINVLKGASASALYGSAGENGVILITTKKGISGKTVVDFSSSTSFDSPLILPKLEGTYGATNVADPNALDNEPFTWGAKNNSASSDHFKDFFRTGINTINSISISSGTDKNQYYASYASTIANGIVETNDLRKNNFYLKASSKISNKITVEGSANLINQDVKNRPYGGFNYNPLTSVDLFSGSSSDFTNYKNNFEVWSVPRGLYEQIYPYSQYNSGSYTLDNPFWTIHKNPNDLKRFKAIFTGSVKIDLTKNINLLARINYDRTDDAFEQDVDASTSTIITDLNGAFTIQKSMVNDLYGDILLTYNKENIGAFSVNATIGSSNSYGRGYNQNLATLFGQNNMYSANVFTLSNLQNGVWVHTENTTEFLNQSVFAAATVGFKNMAFLDLTGRNEWSSTIIDLSQKHFFYPSIGGSFILTELIPQNNILNFAKLRATYSEVGNQLPYGINNPYEYQGLSIASGIYGGVTVGTPFPLKPERSKSMEIGGNLRLLSNMLDLDVTYYNNNIENQFFQVPAPVGYSYTLMNVNAGKINNKGVEIMLTYKLPTKGAFKYSTTINYAYNKNKVLTASNYINYFVVTPYSSTKICDIRMVPGGQFGDLYAPTFQRDASGKVIVDVNGSPLPTTDYVKVGNPNSPTSLGWSNTLSYKKLTLRFQIDARIGGKVISVTESDLDQTGRSQRSADARNKGYVMFEGVKYTNVQAWYAGLAGIGSNYAYSATNVRLREVSLGYDLPVSFTKGIIKKWNISVYGKNLLFLVNKAPFDPEMSAGSATGIQGIDAFAMPSTRSIGFALTATF